VRRVGSAVPVERLAVDGIGGMRSFSTWAAFNTVKVRAQALRRAVCSSSLPSVLSSVLITDRRQVVASASRSS
jgi:hypothetical protein